MDLACRGITFSFGALDLLDSQRTVNRFAPEDTLRYAERGETARVARHRNAAGSQPSDALRAELVDHVRKVLGPIAAPAELEFAAKLPKTRSGKIMRRVLMAQELGQDPGDVSTIEE